MKKPAICIITLALLAASPFSMYPQEADKTTNESSTKDPKENKKEEPGYHEHDGFYFRYLTGFGHGFLYTDQKANSYKSSQGLLQLMNFQLGYSVSKKVIVFGGFELSIMPSPIGVIPFESPLEQLMNSCNLQLFNDCTIKNKTPSLDFFKGSYSLGVSYYFMPENMYVSMEILFSVGRYFKLSVENGYGLQASVGKEWWVSKNWGLGLALNVSYDYFSKTFPVGPIITPLHAFTFGLSFSATYN